MDNLAPYNNLLMHQPKHILIEFYQMEQVLPN